VQHIFLNERFRISTKTAKIEVSELALQTDAGVSHNSESFDHPATQTSTGVWSGKVFMWLFLCQDALAFFGLFAAYLSVRIGAGALWPSPGALHPAAGIEPNPLNINLTAVNTFILICSSVTMVQALKAIKDGNKATMLKWLAATAIGGAIFMGIQFTEYNKLIHIEHMKMPTSLFDATFFILTGFHGMHVLAGVVYLSALAIAGGVGTKVNRKVDVLMVAIAIGLAFGLRAAILAFFGLDALTASIVASLYGITLLAIFGGVRWLLKNRALSDLVEVAGLYWHFVDLVWIILFTLVYLI
jgi:heme/copper-type cytochrome/quinol oxidase subunit 3